MKKSNIIIVISLVLLLLPINLHADNWIEVSLSGKYKWPIPSGHGSLSYEPGEGDVEYSFALKKIVPRSGDIRFLTALSDHNARVVDFTISGASYYDLGVLVVPPSRLQWNKLEKKFKSDDRPCYPDDRAMIIGHYYLLNKPYYIIMQVLEYDCNNFEEFKVFSDPNRLRAKCSIKFRYLMAVKSPEDINALLPSLSFTKAGP